MDEALAGPLHEGDHDGCGLDVGRVASYSLSIQGELGQVLDDAHVTQQPTKLHEEADANRHKGCHRDIRGCCGSDSRRTCDE
jgi:hypothetical protein